MSEIMVQALELLGLGMGGIFIVMFLLYGISQLLLKLTAPKKED
ncbi:MAG: OadG-related small transporter subunit [Lacrimispora sp.]